MGSKATPHRAPGPHRHSMPSLQRTPASLPSHPSPVAQSIAFVSSFHSTPLRPSAHAAVSRGGNIRTPLHRDWVIEHFRDKIVWDMEPEKFIESVWGHQQSPKMPMRVPGVTGPGSRSYRLYKDPLQAWIRESDELRTYGSLSEMFNGLLVQLYGADSNPRRIARKLPARFRARNKKYVGGYTDEKVDMSYSVVPTDAVQRLRWDFEAAFIEVKKEYCDPDFVVKEHLKIRPDTPKQASQKGKRKRDAGDVEAGGTPPAKKLHQLHQESGSDGAEGEGRDEDAGPSGADDCGQSADPALPPPKLTYHEAQAVRYMNNLMSSNVRSFGIGWLIEDDNLRLWYGDRMGLVVTKRMKWLQEDLWLLLRCVAAMGQASLHEMGIFPDLHFPTQAGADSASSVPESLFQRYDGAWLSMTAQAPDAAGEESFQFDLDVQSGSRVYTEFGVLGRGTSVLPIVAKPQTETATRFGDEKLVAKISWPHASRRTEDSLIIAVRRSLQKKKPSYLRHVVNLKCSVTRTMDQIGIPRVNMDLRPEQADERVCRTLVLKRYERLETVASVEDFKMIFVDVVRAHYWIWTVASVLHRDISTSNIMWFRVGDKVFGVLCDWDLAEQRGACGSISSTRAHERWVVHPAASASNEPAQAHAVNQQSDSSSDKSSQDPQVKPRYRTGTGPFMAMDLLRPSAPPLHLYRYDLESLFYVLVYVCIVLDMQQKKFRPLPEWERPTLIDIGTQKGDFLKRRDAYNALVGRCDPAFQSLVAEGGWAFRLWVRFRAVESLAARIDWLHEDAKAIGCAIDEQEVARLNEARDKEIDYDKFMAILGAPTDVPVPFD